MENLEIDNYKTKSHSEDLDFMFNQDSEDFSDVIFESEKYDFGIKSYLRYFRKKVAAFWNKKNQKNFTNILYLTLDCPPFTQISQKEETPLEYIEEMRKQYPDNDIRVLIPIIGLEDEFRTSEKLHIKIGEREKEVEKTNIFFSFFLQNKTHNAIIYKYPKLKSNIQVYGIYCPAFSYLKSVSKLSSIQFLAPFMSAVKIAVKKLVMDNFSPDVIHCENVPFYLGGEFEFKIPTKYKVLQIVKDFTQIDVGKPEAFWAAINFADRISMKRICSDSIIRKNIFKLFSLYNDKKVYNIKECLSFIYRNYYKFRKFVDKGEDIEENIVFNRLNARIFQLFPQSSYGEEIYFNPMAYSLKKADFWATISKTYYNEVFENPKLSGKIFPLLEKTKQKSSYILYGCSIGKCLNKNSFKVYERFDIENFRECRPKNKKILIKEFNIDRIKTKFIDSTLFKSNDVKIIGYLDSFYDAPLIFINPTSEVFANGIDIVFNTILKLFELNRNIQVIICINEGLKSNYIKTWIDYLSENKKLNGKWVFIDGKINPAKFYASADMTFIPRRANLNTLEHFLALNYGCVPVVARSGILNDTISDIFDDMTYGCGFKTKTTLLTNEDNNVLFLTPVLKALNIYQNNSSGWNLLIKNSLNYESNWAFNILEKYNKIYKEIADAE